MNPYEASENTGNTPVSLSDFFSTTFQSTAQIPSEKPGITPGSFADIISSTCQNTDRIPDPVSYFLVPQSDVPPLEVPATPADHSCMPSVPVGAQGNYEAESVAATSCMLVLDDAQGNVEAETGAGTGRKQRTSFLRTKHPKAVPITKQITQFSKSNHGKYHSRNLQNVSYKEMFYDILEIMNTRFFHPPLVQEILAHLYRKNRASISQIKNGRILCKLYNTVSSTEPLDLCTLPILTDEEYNFLVFGLTKKCQYLSGMKKLFPDFDINKPLIEETIPITKHQKVHCIEHKRFLPKICCFMQIYPNVEQVSEDIETMLEPIYDYFKLFHETVPAEGECMVPHFDRIVPIQIANDSEDGADRIPTGSIQASPCTPSIAELPGDGS